MSVVPRRRTPGRVLRIPSADAHRERLAPFHVEACSPTSPSVGTAAATRQAKANSFRFRSASPISPETPPSSTCALARARCRGSRPAIRRRARSGDSHLTGRRGGFHPDCRSRHLSVGGRPRRRAPPPAGAARRGCRLRSRHPVQQQKSATRNGPAERRWWPQSSRGEPSSTWPKDTTAGALHHLVAGTARADVSTPSYLAAAGPLHRQWRSGRAKAILTRRM